ncbi:MAG: hypothetical protein C0518_11280 [Opitutus sp.]|nr:hypothetical protein [Opitutus sp.]
MHQIIFRTLLLLSAALVTLTVLRAAERDPIEGRWLTETGTPDNLARVGLEISRNDQDALVIHYTIDLVNFHRVPLPAPLHRVADGRYAIPAYQMELTLEHERLRVTELLDEPLVLRRVDQLPQPRVRPEWPRGSAPRWQVALGGEIFAAPAVRDGFAYVGTTHGVLFALNIADGARLWTFAAGRPIHSEAVTTEDAVFFTCDNGFLFRLQRADGKEVWRYDLGDARVSRIPPNPFVFDYDHRGATPLLLDGVLYVGAADGGFHAVNVATGERVWRAELGGKIRTQAAAHGANLIVGTLAKRLVALDRATGREIWSVADKGAVTSSPAIAGDVAIVGSRGALLRGIDARSGTELWSQNWFGSWVESSAVLHEGRAYIGSGDLFLVSEFDPATGRNLWRTHVYGWVLNRPAVTDEFVYVGVSGAKRRPTTFLKQAGGVTALHRTTGEVAWHWPSAENAGSFLHGVMAPPVVAGDTLLAAGVDGTFSAFPLR